MAAFVALEARIENPIMPMRILRLRGLVKASLVRGFLVTGMYSTFFLGSLYLEHVRHYSAAPDRRGLPALDAHGRRPVAGHHRAAGRPVWAASACSSRAWRARSIGLLLFSTVGPDTAFFPTIFLACFAIGLGHRQRVHAAADDRNGRRARRRLPGLGSGITNVSQQISGALGLAVLSTIAANRTKGLLVRPPGPHHAP